MTGPLPKHIADRMSQPMRPERNGTAKKDIPLAVANQTIPVMPDDLRLLKAWRWVMQKVPPPVVGVVLVMLAAGGLLSPVWSIVLGIGFAWLKEATEHVGLWYVTVRKFLAAHAYGFCDASERAARLSFCNRCDLRSERLVGRRVRNFCAAEQETCNCGHWRGSALEHKTRLANWACPLGYFDKATGENKVLIAEAMKGKSDGE